ncbi:hypothetical protein OG520_00730 [Streptomyces sp. NBC_00984]|uniref:hypothetical protein n=1 Tax=Streptomyces sp. NBC_00984 TaxID=2903700 RepID=UPI003869120A|nr:hypothetical protein OG520_00730 [Streptomyces sp. NBC_00984]
MPTALSRTPATRLFAAEALSTVLFSVPMLLFTTPSHPRVPEWFQLLGLGLLLTMIGATVHTWRRTIADELIPAGRTGPAAGGACGRLREQLGAERRLRRLLILYPAVLVLLLPVPDTWVNFWFWSTLLAAVAGLISLGLLLRTPGRRGRT